ncbi:MAG: MucR family transcriptional regulator [Hyphomicrobiaceae bacterium]
MAEDVPKLTLIEQTTQIVQAYVGNNTIDVKDVSTLINEVHQALMRASGEPASVQREERQPAVKKNRSVMPDYIICLEDGKKFKSLKRHLRTHYNLSPEEYREKWELPPDYPMVAPNYARARSELAKKMGLGTRRDR